MIYSTNTDAIDICTDDLDYIEVTFYVRQGASLNELRDKTDKVFSSVAHKLIDQAAQR